MEDFVAVLETGFELTGDLLDFVPIEDILTFLHTHMSGSDRRFFAMLGEVGLLSTTRRFGKKTIRGRVGIRHRCVRV